MHQQKLGLSRGFSFKNGTLATSSPTSKGGFFGDVLGFKKRLLSRVVMPFAAVGLTISAASTAQAQNAAASTLPTFTCDGYPYQVQSGQLKKFDPITLSYSNVGSDLGSTNGNGYNVIDNYAYGTWNSQSLRLMRIGGDGSGEIIGDNPPGGSSEGTMDESGNFIPIDTSNVYLVDVEATAVNVDSDGSGYPDVVYTTVPIIADVATGNKYVAGGDIAWFEDGGQEYVLGLRGINPPEFRVINLSTGQLTYTEGTLTGGTPAGTSWGAIWRDSNGRILAFNNNSGNIFEVTDAVSSNPQMSFLVNTPSSGSNDGFNCSAAPFPNIPPTAEDDDFFIPAAITSTLDLAIDNGNGPDNDPENLPLTVAAITSPASNGTVTINTGTSTVDYTPNVGFSGFDTFDYNIQDQALDTAPAVVTVTIGDFDMGDAPATYGYAIHADNSDVYFIGSGFTYDGAILSSAAADTDTDDGVSLPAEFLRNETASIVVTVEGAGGYLQGFIDWDGNGDFTGADEQIAVDVTDGGAGDTDAVTGTITIDVPVPLTATLGATFTRFRFSSEAGVDDQNLATDGEAEDYPLTIELEKTTDLVTVKGLGVGLGSTASTGDTTGYLITVTNNGPDDATNVSLTDVLPAGLTATASNGAVSSGTYDSATGVWTILALANGDSESLTLEGTINVDQGGLTITNTLAAPAAGDQVDPGTVGDDLTEAVTVEESAPSLSMTKIADNEGPHMAGDVVTYTYTVTNDGDQVVDDIAITDTHNGSDPAPTPTNEALLTDTAPTGDSTDATPADGNWDSLAPGDVVTFTGTYTVTQTDVDNL